MKRVFDVVLSIILLFFMIPVILLLSIIVLLTLGKPIFFRQDRPGLNGPLRTDVALNECRSSNPQSTCGSSVLDQSKVDRYGCNRNADVGASCQDRVPG